MDWSTKIFLGPVLKNLRSIGTLHGTPVPLSPHSSDTPVRDVLCQKCPTFLSIYWTSLFRITRGKEKKNAIAIVSGVYCKVTEWKVWIIHRLLQAVLLQQHSFLHQLTQNMTLNMYNFQHFFVLTNENTNQNNAKNKMENC